MKTTAQPKSNPNILTIKPLPLPIGHQPRTAHHVHADRRTRRNRTRSEQSRRALEA